MTGNSKELKNIICIFHRSELKKLLFTFFIEMIYCYMQLEMNNVLQDI